MKYRKIVKTVLLSLLVYVVALLYFFPVLYMILTGFKTEYEAAYPSLAFTPTLKTFADVLGDPKILRFLGNSLFQTLLGTLCALSLGVPAAFALIFGRFKKKTTKDALYVWFITTILLPPVAVLIPLYLVFLRTGLLHTPFGLLLAYIGFNTPIVVWMVRSFFSDVPVEIVEAAEIDGCTRFQQLTRITLPLVRVGVISAGLLVAVFIWNSFFLAYNLTKITAETISVYMARFSEQEGLFVAHLSAAGTVAVLPAIVAGWMTQKALTKGLTQGAVKG
jgi:sorbitol/mannitol transport system permease protein